MNKLAFVYFAGLLVFGTGCSGDDGNDSGVSAPDEPGNETGDGDGDGDSVAGDGDGDEDGTPEACADSCAGCCDGDICIEIPTPDQCGGYGEACFSCESWQYCGNDHVIGFGRCHALSDSKWTVTVESVRAYAQQEGSASWDLLDGPDLKVCLEINGEQLACTSPCLDSQICLVNEELGSIRYEDTVDGIVELVIYDEDIDSDDLAGTVRLWANDLEQGGMDDTNPEDVGYERLVVSLAHE